MGSLQRALENILGHLKGFSPTSKLLVGSLLVILVMTLFFVSIYAGSRELVPLPTTALTVERRAEVVQFLSSRRIDHEDAGGTILVPADQKMTILAQLNAEQVIGTDEIDFQSLLSEESPFSSREQNRQRYQVAKMRVLERVIEGISGIRSASVIIDLPRQQTPIGRPDLMASASVTVTTDGAGLTQGQVDAVARMVAGAQSGLKATGVTVIDAVSGVSRQPSEVEVGGPGYIARKKEVESHIRREIMSLLRLIPNVTVSVNAQVEHRRTESAREGFEDPKVGPKSESSRNISSTSTKMAKEPGARSNTGADIGAGGGTGSKFTDDQTKSELESKFGTEFVRSSDNGGQPLKVTASIGVPRSYFVTLYKAENPDEAEEPTDATLGPLMDAHIQRIRDAVTPLIDTEAISGAKAGAVTVTMFPDLGLAILGASAGAGGSGGGGVAGMLGDEGGMVGSIVKYVSLAGLSLASLGMMFLMVKRATVREELPTAEDLVGIPPPVTDAESDIMGEADEATAPMEGMEMDEAAIENAQMLEQVNHLAAEKPDEAAAILRKWIRQT